MPAARPQLPDLCRRRQRTWSRKPSIVGAALPSPVAQQGEIDLGTCVRVSLSGGRSRYQMTEEGVVIEVVEPDTAVRSARVAFLQTPIAEERRYVIQCWSRRVLRHASGMIVVAL